MKYFSLKKITITITITVIVLMAIILGAYSSIADENSISLNSPTTFPVDI